MLSLKKAVKFVIICTSLVAITGCNEAKKPQKISPLADQFAGANENAAVESNAAKYEQTVQADTTIDSAIELSQKYALLSEENIKLKEKNKAITDENQRFKENVTALQTQLDQTKKELADANDLLVEMRIELNNWKTDILGFRDEMRDAQQAQLEALLKVLTILGAQTDADTITEAEPPAETFEEQNIQSPNEPNNPTENN